MDKLFIVDVYTKHLNNNLSTNNALTVVINYCFDNGKSQYNTMEFVKHISNVNMLMHYFIIAISFYMAKFNVCTLTNKEGKIISIF